jgi:putative ABC transport system substrate-binding protein
VDVILTAGTESTDAARKATTNIPIVMAAVGDPIAAGFIVSLAQPGETSQRQAFLRPS